jgi:hypothetical protein
VPTVVGVQPDAGLYEPSPFGVTDPMVVQPAPPVHDAGAVAEGPYTMYVIAPVVVPELEVSAAVRVEPEIAVFVKPLVAVVATLSEGDHLPACTVIFALEAPQIDEAFLFCESPV